jgi:hypothetical protein
MKDIPKEERDMVTREARALSMELSKALSESQWDKRSVVFATVKLAAGTCRAAKMSKHAAVTLFMTMFNDADEHFSAKGR